MHLAEFIRRSPARISFLLLMILSSAGCRSNCQNCMVGPPLRTSAEVPVEWQSGGIVGTQATEVLPTPGPVIQAQSTLSLEDCLRLAFERQPRIAAQRASLATAQAGLCALEKMRIPASLSAQIPHRRKQAALIIVAAAGALDQVERETAYAVTRTYLTVQFAREQEAVAKSAVERLNAVREAAEKALDLGARDVTAADVTRATFYVRMAETKHIQAVQGIKRALVALREAMGLGPEFVIEIPAGGLPEAAASPEREAVLAVALAKRGELAQARALAQITCIEGDAQATSISQRMETFAAGIDIHSTQVPQGSNGIEYRPPGLPPEMPTLLLGTRPERLKQVQALMARAENVLGTTRNLVALEVEDAFLRWEESSQQSRKAREAAETGDKLADELRKDLAAGLKVKIEDVVAARMLASQARADYNEYHYRELVALADLERATAGGFCAGLNKKK